MTTPPGIPSAGGVDVVVVGGTGIDTSVFLHGGDVDFVVEANFTENIDYVGQAGGYSARGFARLGKRTALIDTVGDDSCGRMIADTLRGDGINLEGLFLDPAGTRRSVNIMYRDGRRKNFYDGKGASSFRPDIARCEAVMAGARLVHINIIDWARRVLPVARRVGATVSCDIQDVVTLDDPYRRDFIDAADILFFSAVNLPDPVPAVRRLLDGHARRVVIAGMGERGCAVGRGDQIRLYPPVPFESPVIDTNGAGDGLAVGFLTSFVLDGFALEDAVLRGQIAARYTCSQRASTSGLIDRQQLDRIFQSTRRL